MGVPVFTKAIEINALIRWKRVIVSLYILEKLRGGGELCTTYTRLGVGESGFLNSEPNRTIIVLGCADAKS